MAFSSVVGRLKDRKPRDTRAIKSSYGVLSSRFREDRPQARFWDLSGARRYTGFGKSLLDNSVTPVPSRSAERGGQSRCGRRQWKRPESSLSDRVTPLVQTSSPPMLSELCVLQENGYRAVSKLGSGKYCKVLLAEDVRLGLVAGANVAIKIIDERKAREEFIDKFLPRETSIWPRLSHPHLVKMKDCFQKDKKTYLVLELADGGDLLDYVQHNGRVCEQQLYYWMKQMIGAVTYLHATANVAHRDLKLENVLIANNGDLKITDFGFCRRIESTTMSSTYCGSKSYSAPELIMGEPYDPRKADVWSLGVIAYILATSRMPFNEHIANHQIIEAQRNRCYSYPKEGVSESCMSFIDLLMTFDCNQRPNLKDLPLRSQWFAQGPLI